VSENKNEKFDLAEPKASPEEDVESARILMREGLIEEAKKILYRVQARQPDLRKAHELLKEIETLELKDLFREAPVSRPKPPKPIEDVDALIESLDRDLGLGLDEGSAPTDPQKEIWKTNEDPRKDLDSKARFDLGVAFFEMGCYSDALRELRRAEKKIRIEESFLGELGVATVSLVARCLIHLERAFEAKAYLEPVLTEPDLRHEDKLALYYAMGLIEQKLGHAKRARGWFQKISETDSDFKDVQIRLRQLGRS